MKIEDIRKSPAAKLTLYQCETGKVYQWEHSNDFYIKTNGNGLTSMISLRTGAFLTWIPDYAAWSLVPDAKLVIE